jgi:ribosomal protein L6P/L9E
VTAEMKDGQLSVKGPKGTLSVGLSDLVEYKLEDGQITITPANDTKPARSHWGLQRTLVSNLVEGVTDGFTKVLEITGVGYRASAQGRKLKLQLGFSHDVDIDVPDGVDVKTPDNTTIEISGIELGRIRRKRSTTRSTPCPGRLSASATRATVMTSQLCPPFSRSCNPRNDTAARFANARCEIFLCFLTSAKAFMG